MLEERYRQTEQIALTMDSLNTHGIESLYESYPPAEARAPTERVEIHYTPKRTRVRSTSSRPNIWIDSCRSLPDSITFGIWTRSAK